MNNHFDEKLNGKIYDDIFTYLMVNKVSAGVFNKVKYMIFGFNSDNVLGDIHMLVRDIPEIYDI